MVLMHRSLMALTLLLAACLGSAPPTRLATSTPLALTVLLESSDGRPLARAEGLERELGAALAARNLDVSVVALDARTLARTTPARLDGLLAASQAPWVLLVEARPRFFSQLSGRYRWEVELRSTLAARDHAAEAHASDLDVAAFLQFEHEREREALDFVRRQVVRDVLALVDRVLRDARAPPQYSSPRVRDQMTSRSAPPPSLGSLRGTPGTSQSPALEVGAPRFVPGHELSVRCTQP